MNKTPMNRDDGNYEIEHGDSSLILMKSACNVRRKPLQLKRKILCMGMKLLIGKKNYPDNFSVMVDQVFYCYILKAYVRVT